METATFGVNTNNTLNDYLKPMILHFSVVRAHSVCG